VFKKKKKKTNAEKIKSPFNMFSPATNTTYTKHPDPDVVNHISFDVREKY